MNGYARGDLEDCGAYCVWWYIQPSTGGVEKRWAFARRSTCGTYWHTGSPKSGFHRREEAVTAAEAQMALLERTRERIREGMTPQAGATPGATVYVTHVYDASLKLQHYYVHTLLGSALYQAAEDVVGGRFGEDGIPRLLEIERVLGTITTEPGSSRRYVRCDMWVAHVDERQVLP